MTENNQNKPAELKDAGESNNNATNNTASEVRSSLYQKVVPPKRQVQRTEQPAKHRTQKPADQVIGGEPVQLEQSAQPNQSVEQIQVRRPRQKRAPHNTAVQQPLQAQQQQKPLQQNAVAQQPQGQKQQQKPSQPRQPRQRQPQQPSQIKPVAQRPGLLSKQPNPRQQSKHSLQNSPKPSIKVYFLGGLNEIGKNFTLFECENDMIIVDCGMAFPSDDMLGVDLVLPDFTFVERNVDKIRGVFLTHGHEDHIGAIPYLLKKVNLPLYGTPLTLGLVGGKLNEHNLLNKAKLNVVHPGEHVKFGCMDIEFIHVNHSIPDSVSFAIHSPAGTVIQTGDFKIECEGRKEIYHIHQAILVIHEDNLTIRA